jgi:hypothetical protein
LSAVLALASPAFAGGKGAAAKSQEKAARAACLMGDYQKGTKILVDLYIETGNPVHLFNQGRCYEQNHRWEQALDRFHEYLRKEPNLEEGPRAYVEKHIAECESHLPKAAPAPPPSPVTPVQPPPPAPTPAPEPEAEKPSLGAASVSPTPPARANDSGSTLRILGIVTAALGVASLGYGTYEYFRRESLIEDLRKKGDQYSDDQYSDKQGQIDASKTRGLIGFGVGAAALVAGTTMYLLGRPSASSGTEHATVTLVPSIGPGQTSLFISGAF